MSTSDATTDLTQPVPTFRELRAGAHQVLLSGPGRGPFVAPDVQRNLLQPGDKLARFLPPATHGTGTRGTAGRTAGGKVEYALPANATRGQRLRLESDPVEAGRLLPRGEIEAFAAAVAAFSGSNAPDGTSLSDLQMSTRRSLRLPDPRMEPDAYWIVGDDFDRRLVVLWGCERFSRSSVPLAEVIAFLRTREIDAVETQEMALRLAMKSGSPLQPHLGKSVTGGVRAGTDMYPPEQLKAVQKVSPKTIKEFAAAAEAFLAPAGDEKEPAFSRELRRALRLPSLDGPGAGQVMVSKKGRVVIKTDQWDLDATVPPAVPPPPLQGDPATDEDPGVTFVNQLERRVQKLALRNALAAAAVVALIGALVAVIKFWPSPTVPELEMADAVDARTVRLVFTEPVAGDAAAVLFADDARTVAGVAVAPDDANALLVTVVEPLTDGEEYTVVATEGIADGSGTALARTSMTFRYLESVAPKLVLTSAKGGNNKQLLVEFDDVIERNSLMRNNVQVFSYSGGQQGRAIPINTVDLDPEGNGRSILVTTNDEMQGNVQYLLVLNGVTDRSVNKNAISGFEHVFVYEDILPPRIKDAVGTTTDMSVTVAFTKPVDPTMALDASHYALLPPGEGATPLPIAANGITLDDTGTVVKLRVDLNRLTRGQHRVEVTGMADKAGHVDENGLTNVFAWSDAMNGSPRNAGIEVTDDQHRNIVLTYDRAIDQEAAADVANYAYRDVDGADRGVRVVSATPGNAPNKMKLLLNSDPGNGGQQIHVSNIRDVFGDVHPGPLEFSFTNIGIGRPTRPILEWSGAKPAEWVNDRTIRLTMNVLVKEASIVADNVIFQPNVKIARLAHRPQNPAGGREHSVVEVELEQPRPARDLSVEIYGFEYDHRRPHGPQQLPQIRVQ